MALSAFNADVSPTFDLVVIGAGSGGLAAAKRAARHGESGDGVGVDVRDDHAQRFARGALVLYGLERIRHRVFLDFGTTLQRRTSVSPGSRGRGFGATTDRGYFRPRPRLLDY